MHVEEETKLRVNELRVNEMAINSYQNLYIEGFGHYKPLLWHYRFPLLSYSECASLMKNVEHLEIKKVDDSHRHRWLDSHFLPVRMECCWSICCYSSEDFPINKSIIS